MKVSPERWQQVSRIYEAAAELDVASRSAFLSQRCAGDDALRHEVESLLRQDGAEVVLDTPLWSMAAALFDDIPALRPGARLGPYRIDAHLGDGGMGTVFRGTDTRLDRRVAIKVLRAGVGGDPQIRARFAREARAIAALTHPNICTLYDVGCDDGIDYLVMEHLEGETLAARLTHGPLPLQAALAIATDIAAALAHAHRVGIIHRDLKPANIMLTGDGAKLLDFGIAKLRASAGVRRQEDTDAPALEGTSRSEPVATDASNTTRDGTIVGTMRYMAPEQVAGRDTDARGDLFSFGVVFYEMLTGRRAFDGEDAGSIRAAVLDREPPSVRASQAQVPAAVDDLVRRCLIKDLDGRWQLATDVVRALKQVTREIEHTGEPSRLSRLSRRGVATAAIAAAVASGAWIANEKWRALPTVAPTYTPVRAVAVLPLKNLSVDQEYLADAVTEQLIADLAGIHSLRVVSRTSTSHYRDTRQPVPEIARALQVDAIIEGAVMHTNDKVQVSASLIRGTTGEVIWTQSFERDSSDLLALQREIARAITSKVHVTLTPEAQVRLAGARPVNPEMHRLVLLGRHEVAKATEASLRKAIGYFDDVISKAPDNALAHMGLAEAYIELSGFYMHPRQAMPRAKRAAQTALALDGSLADAHAALGYVHLVYDWDGPSAEKELVRALDLNSTLAMARLNYAAYLASQNRHSDAVTQIRTAVNLDPVSIRTYSFGTLFLLFARRYDEAIDLAQKGLEFEPASAFTKAFLGAAYSSVGRHRDAVDELRAAVELDHSLTIRALQAHVLASAGRHEEARVVLRELEDEARTRYFCPYEVATVYVSLGDQDTAAAWFRKGIEDRADCMPWLGVEPWIAPFRRDPRYERMLKEIGLTPLTDIAH